MDCYNFTLIYSITDSPMREEEPLQLQHTQEICKTLYTKTGPEKYKQISIIYGKQKRLFQEENLARQLSSSLNYHMCQMKKKLQSTKDSYWEYCINKMFMLEMLLNSYFGEKKIQIYNQNGQFISFLLNFDNDRSLNEFHRFLMKDFQYALDTWDQGFISKICEVINFDDTKVRPWEDFQNFKSQMIKNAKQIDQDDEISQMRPQNTYPFLNFDNHLMSFRLSMFSRHHVQQMPKNLLTAMLIVSLPTYYQKLFQQVKNLVRQLVENQKNQFVSEYLSFIKMYAKVYEERKTGYNSQELQANQKQILQILKQGIENSVLVLIPTRSVYGITINQIIYCNVIVHLMKKQPHNHRQLTITSLSLTLLHELAHLLVRKFFPQINHDSSFLEHQKQQFSNRKKYRLSSKVVKFIQNYQQQLKQVKTLIGSNIQESQKKLKSDLFYCYLEKTFSQIIKQELVQQINSYYQETHNKLKQNRSQQILHLMKFQRSKKLFKYQGVAIAQSIAQSQNKRSKLISHLRSLLITKYQNNKYLWLQDYLETNFYHQPIQQPYKSLLKFVQEFYDIKKSQISLNVTANQDERFTNLCDIFQSLLVKIEKFDFLQELVEQLQNQEEQKSKKQVNKSDKIMNLVKIYLEGKKDNYLKFRFDKLFSNSKSKHAASQYLLYKLIDYTPTLLQVYDSVGIQSLKQTTFQQVRAQLKSNKVEPLEFLMLEVSKILKWLNKTAQHSQGLWNYPAKNQHLLLFKSCGVETLRDEFGSKEVAIQQGYKGQKLNVAMEAQHLERIGTETSTNASVLQQTVPLKIGIKKPEV